jgi:NAD(P)H dehydrogenase (quinone)
MPVSWTAHADLAEAAAIVLADEGRLDGLTRH